MKRVEIIVNPDGSIHVETFGFKGKACAAVTAELLEQLGGKQDEKKKAEWYYNEQVNAQQDVKVGA